MPYWQLLYHIVWATEHRARLITPQVEPVVYKLIAAKATELGGKVYVINGDEEHVHVVTTIPPRIAVASFVGKVKGASSGAMNKRARNAVPFYWQAEYGAFSFDGKCLPHFLAYVQKQKEHHAQGTLIPILERIQEEIVIREDGPIYSADSVEWHAYMASL
jgi:putative transposase